MTGYKGSFKKKDGSIRVMRFVKAKDLPSSFLEGKVKNKQKHVLGEGMELVWDLDEQEFRIFNYNNVVDNPEEFEYTLP